MGKVYDEFRDLFNPEIRRRKALAKAAADEAEARARLEALTAEVGALAASPVVRAYREELLSLGSKLQPGPQMDAAGAFWFRKGLEQAVNMLDEKLATAEEQNA